MILQIKYFLYVYYSFLTVWFLFFLVSIYHILKFGFKNISTYIITIVFIGVALSLLAVSLNYISIIDWSAEITILPNIFNSSPIF